MSLAVAVLQIAAFKALNGQVGAKVFLADADPRDLATELQPLLIVSASSGKRNIPAREILGGRHVAHLALELGVARQVTQRRGEGENEVVVEFAPTDAMQDLLLHTVGYECERILLSDTGAWAELFRRLWWNHAEEELSFWDRGAAAEPGIRLALLRQVYALEVLSEPTPGAPLPDVWSDLFAAMEADTDVNLQQLGAYWRSLITLPSLADWQQAQAQLGLTLGGIRGMGIAPVFETSDEPAPLATQGEGEDQSRTEITIITVNLGTPLTDEEGAILTDEDEAWLTDEEGEATITEGEDAPVILSEVPGG